MVTWEKDKGVSIWNNGEFETESACIEEAKRNGFKAGDIIYIGDCVKPDIYVDFSYVLECVEEQMYDEVGEAAEDWNISIIEGIYDVYEERLKELVSNYLKEIGEEPSFYKVENIREVTITE